jgi:hypothetical protein
MKATSTDTISFPALNWGINAGEVRDLPSDKDAQAIILSHPSISLVGQKEKPEQKPLEK